MRERRALRICVLAVAASAGCKDRPSSKATHEHEHVAGTRAPARAGAPASDDAPTKPDEVALVGETEGQTTGAKSPEDAPAAPATAPDGTAILACGEPPPGMACIPGGPFIRGKDGVDTNTHPAAEIWLQTYYMDVNEVTNAEYSACEAARECTKAGPRYVDFDRPRQPINGVNWFDADGYCRAQGKHLPTEAQWEKAARGSDGRTYPWGEEPATCANAIIKGVEGRGCGVRKRGSKPETGRPWEIGARAPNQFGLFDMAGNSFEWVADWYTPSYEACGEACAGFDPAGPCAGAATCSRSRRKVVRGGSWYWEADRATTFHRRAHVPANQPFHHFGFRCAASIAEAAGRGGGAPA